MEASVCLSCNTPAPDNAIFCYNCGLQLKCKACMALLLAGAHHCTACGESIALIPDIPVNNSLNTFKLRETKEERLYEINFTNDVGKEIKEVIADLIKNKVVQDTDNQLLIREPLRQPDRIIAQELPAEPVSAAEQLLTTELQSEENLQKTEPEADYPHLNDLEIKLNCKENEWLLLFSFYVSDYGAKTFNKNSVWQLYKDKRITETRFKNLGTNWKSLFKKYISTVRENEFRFTAAGLTKAKSLLVSSDQRKSISYSPRKAVTYTNTNPGTVRNMPISRKVVANSILPNEFDVYKNDTKVSLEDFFKQKQPGNGNPNRIVTFAYYITKINHQEYFTEGNIDFAYRILNLTGKPVHLKQVIINLKNDRIWFQKVIDKRTNGWRLTRQAEIYVEEKLTPLS